MTEEVEGGLRPGVAGPVRGRPDLAVRAHRHRRDPAARRWGARRQADLRVLPDRLDFVDWARQRASPECAWFRRGNHGRLRARASNAPRLRPAVRTLLDPDRASTRHRHRHLRHGRPTRSSTSAEYGHVAQIITFGRLAARRRSRTSPGDGLRPSECQRLSNLVPAGPNITIDEAPNKEPELRQACEDDLRATRQDPPALEDHARHAGVRRCRRSGDAAARPIVPLCQSRAGRGRHAVGRPDP